MAAQTMSRGRVGSTIGRAGPQLGQCSIARPISARRSISSQQARRLEVLRHSSGEGRSAQACGLHVDIGHTGVERSQTLP